MLLYSELYPKGTSVKIASRPELEQFRRTWRFHHKLEAEQLSYADQTTVVKAVGFYHGGDVLYELQDAPGIWHESCLRPAISIGQTTPRA